MSLLWNYRKALSFSTQSYSVHASISMGTETRNSPLDQIQRLRQFTVQLHCKAIVSHQLGTLTTPYTQDTMW